MTTTPTLVRKVLEGISQLDDVGIHLLRVGVAIIFIWIGALKFFPYEADSITPFVANSPVMSFFYKSPGEYKEHLTHEGQLDPVKREWQTQNHTYSFSDGLGTVEILIGLMVLSYVFSRRLGMVGSILAFLTPLVTLSFLITTPEAWVSNIGDAQFGVPFLSGGGRLVLKDVLTLAGAVVMMADSARQLLQRDQATLPYEKEPV
ncbi:reactive chlorine resistance membrane protein RclC [Pseudomonas petrae]|uniref:Reactive chlorine resistance membrane protein RclC n=1 Tax=Pseudomonas petrae TaxID=2912190 RepID=A0ABS9I932_9PSED|nr:reactive chlorine resistance membrane protein RclC [Pseudomonas petrae]MCF7544260.1 reactive chlorine resistance membrane protein RclC [Pseudomonas petrae]